MPKRPRRFLVNDLGKNAAICLNATESHHLRHVLRLKVGDPCLVADETGKEAEASVAAFLQNGTVELAIKKTSIASKPASRLVVAQALPQKGVMDSIVEKAGELGIHTLLPMITEHTQVHPDSVALERLAARWMRLADAAAKQSGNRPVTIAPVASFSEILNTIHAPYRAFMAHTRTKSRTLGELAKEIPDSADALCYLFIGPEGGFSEKECAWFISKNIGPVFSLPGGTLRSDTAFVALTSLFRFGTGVNV